MIMVFKSSWEKIRDYIIALCRFESCDRFARLKELSATRSLPMRYIFVGVLGAIVEMTLFAFLFRLDVGIVISNIAAFHVAFIMCYFFHYYYTHRKPFEGKSALANGLVKYTILMYGQLIIGSILLWILIKKFGLDADFSKIIQICIVTPGSYMIQKSAIFRTIK